jgi:hypothetical protein
MPVFWIIALVTFVVVFVLRASRRNPWMHDAGRAGEAALALPLALFIWLVLARLLLAAAAGWIVGYLVFRLTDLLFTVCAPLLAAIFGDEDAQTAHWVFARAYALGAGLGIAARVFVATRSRGWFQPKAQRR